MSPDVKHVLVLIATVTALTLGALSGLAYAAEPEGADVDRVADVVFVVLERNRDDIKPARAKVISKAVAVVAQDYPGHPMMAATLLTAMEQESHFLESVHSGELRGKAGEICMTQIHPTNGFWKKHAERFEQLAGTDLESTTRCLRAAASTLSWARRTCLREHYRKNWAQAMWTRYHYSDRCWLSPHAHKRTRRMQHWQKLLLQEERRQETNKNALLGAALGAAGFAWLGFALFRAFTPPPPPYVVEYVSPKLDPEELRNL